MNLRALSAETFGTFVLTFVVLLSVAGEFPISTPVLASLTLALFVYTIGAISGCHINPAVTVGLWSVGKISQTQAVRYIIAQFIGSGIALLLAGTEMSTPSPFIFTIVWGELLGTALFTFGITSVVWGKVTDSMAGIVIGGSLLLGVAVSVLLGGPGILNPAVAFGLQQLSIGTVLGPLFGAVIGMQGFAYLSTPERSGSKSR